MKKFVWKVETSHPFLEGVLQGLWGLSSDTIGLEQQSTLIPMKDV